MRNFCVTASVKTVRTDLYDPESCAFPRHTDRRGGYRWANFAPDLRRCAVVHAPAYLTFDIDCLDPAFAPGTGTSVAGGLSSAQALEIVRALGPIDLVGADVVEVAPPYDHSDVTALAATHIAVDMLCLMRNQTLQRLQCM